jgi:hypothetical protein
VLRFVSSGTVISGDTLQVDFGTVITFRLKIYIKIIFFIF